MQNKKLLYMVTWVELTFFYHKLILSITTHPTTKKQSEKLRKNIFQPYMKIVFAFKLITKDIAKVLVWWLIFF